MANEITVQVGLIVRKDNIRFQPPVATFRADMGGDAGPAVGSIPVSTSGTDVDFSPLSDPGWLRLTNQEADGGSDVDVGLHDPEANRFYPLFVLSPGQSMVACLSPQFGWQEFPAGGVTTGTGTGGGTNTLHLRAVAHALYVLVEAFER